MHLFYTKYTPKDTLLECVFLILLLTISSKEKSGSLKNIDKKAYTRRGCLKHAYLY